MKLAFEAPLDDTDLAMELSDYIFGIASKLSDKRYSEAIRDARADGKVLFLDNGAYEGELLDTPALLDLCEVWEPEVIVTPDVIEDYPETTKRSREFIEGIEKLTHKPKLLGVIQGTTDNEKYWCYNEFYEMGIDIIGLGLAAFKKDWRHRIQFFERHIRHGVPIHVLGAANIHDICYWKTLVDTLDTSLPFHLAQERKSLFEAKATKRIDWEKKLDREQMDQLVKNMTLLRGTLAYV